MTTKETTDFVIEFVERFDDAMDDDFNTPVALAVLFDLARELNKAKEQNADTTIPLAETLIGLGRLLGILQADPDVFLKGGKVGVEQLSEQTIDALIQARSDAKTAKNWAEADRIRDELKAQNVILEDASGGITKWRRE